MRPEEAERLEREIDRLARGNDLAAAGDRVRSYLAAAGTVPTGGDVARSPWFRARYVGAGVALAAGAGALGRRHHLSVLNTGGGGFFLAGCPFATG